MKPLSRVNMLIMFGLLIMLIPFSGLPIALRTVLQMAFGAIVFATGLSMRSEELRKSHAAVEPASPAAPEPPAGMSPI